MGGGGGFNWWKRKPKRLEILKGCGAGSVLPQQLEKLGVLPIKLRGGLGQPPETWNQVPQGST